VWKADHGFRIHILNSHWTQLFTPPGWLLWRTMTILSQHVNFNLTFISLCVCSAGGWWPRRVQNKPRGRCGLYVRNKPHSFILKPLQLLHSRCDWIPIRGSPSVCAVCNLMLRMLAAYRPNLWATEPPTHRPAPLEKNTNNFQIFVVKIILKAGTVKNIYKL